MNNEILIKINGFLENTKYKCVDLVVKGERNTKVLEIYADSKEVLNIEELAKLNRDLWELLESNNLTKNISKFTVSSPGADKPFKFIWQVEKHTGKLLEIKLKNGGIICGKLIEIRNENCIVLEILKNNKEKEIKGFNFEEIQESKVKLKFK